MSDSYELSALPEGAAQVVADAGYSLFDNMTTEELRNMASDWIHAQQQYRKCSECPNVADGEYEMAEHPETGQLICWECIKRMAEEAAAEDDDEGMERLFRQIRSAAE